MSYAPFINAALISLARQEDVLVVFPHCQRTGGKTLRDRVLGPAYGLDKIYSNSRGTGSKSWRAVSGRDLASFRVYTGSFNFQDLNKGRPIVLVGMLRNPLYRAASVYFYCRGRRDHPLHPIAAHSTLEEFYFQASRVTPKYFHNLQCMRICSKPDAGRAKDLIESRYVGVGLTSEIGAFADALGEALGWPPIEIKSGTSDAERYDALLTPRLREAVQRESSEDLRLFEWASTGQLPERERRPFFSLFATAAVAADTQPGVPAPDNSHVPAMAEGMDDPYRLQDEAFASFKREHPHITFGQYATAQHFQNMKASSRVSLHHSLGANLGDAEGNSIDFWTAGDVKARRLMQMMELKAGDKVIEYGCGSLRLGGHFIRFLEPERYFGLDVIDGYFEIGKTLVGADLLAQKRPKLGVINDANLSEAEAFGADRVFSNAVCVHVHPDDIGDYLNNLARLARKPGARLWFNAAVSDVPSRHGFSSWSWPVEFIKERLCELEFISVTAGKPIPKIDHVVRNVQFTFRRKSDHVRLADYALAQRAAARFAVLKAGIRRRLRPILRGTR